MTRSLGDEELGHFLRRAIFTADNRAARRSHPPSNALCHQLNISHPPFSDLLAGAGSSQRTGCVRLSDMQSGPFLTLPDSQNGPLCFAGWQRSMTSSLRFSRRLCLGGRGPAATSAALRGNGGDCVKAMFVIEPGPLRNPIKGSGYTG